MLDMYHENQTKNKILAAAVKLMNHSGYGGLSISELARSAGISKQNLYYHYPDMEDVLMDLSYIWSSTGQECAIQALAASQQQGSRKILDLCHGTFLWIQRYPELSNLSLVLFQSQAQVKKLNKFMTDARDKGRERILSFLILSEPFQSMKAKDLDQVLNSVHAILYGASFYVFVTGDFKNLAHHEISCRDSLERLLGTYLS